MSRSRRALGYARVSSAEQALGTSLRDQQAAITAYAKARGITEVRFFVEAESAIHEKIERREQIQSLLREVRSGDLVLVDKLDRWSRDPEFTHGSVRRLREAGATFVSVAENLDASTNEGDFMLGIRAVLAKEEHRRIRIRTVGTRALLADQGYFVSGLPPFGYRRRHPKGTRNVEKNILQIVPEEAAIVRKLFALYLGGLSMPRVAKKIGWKLSRVKNTLCRRTYLGEVPNSKGEWIRGKHEPIIDAATFARVQQTAAARRLGGPRPRGAPSRTDTWILRDVARCGRCGSRMSAGWSKSGEYYCCARHCQSTGTRATNGSWIRVDVVEPAFAPMVIARLKDLRAELARGPEPAPDAPVDLEVRRERLARRRARYQEMYADEQMTRDELRAALARLDAEGARLDAEERTAGVAARTADPAVRRAILAEVGAIEVAWRRADPARRRAIVRRLAREVRIVAGELPSPAWAPAAELVRDV